MRLRQPKGIAILSLILSFVCAGTCLLLFTACREPYVYFPEDIPSTGYTYVIESYEPHDLITPQTTISITYVDYDYDTNLLDKYALMGITIGSPFQYKFENLSDSFQSIHYVTADKKKYIWFDYYLKHDKNRHGLDLVSENWSEGCQIYKTNIKFICIS